MQIGHPVPPVRAPTLAVHLCPKLHFQVFFLGVPFETVVGSHPSAWAAISGCVVARSLKPICTAWPAQTAHPAPYPRLFISATQLCPSGHFHFALDCDVAETVVGSQPSACAANSGCVSASEGFEVLAIFVYLSDIVKKGCFILLEAFSRDGPVFYFFPVPNIPH